MPLHVSSKCAYHQEVKIALHSLWYHHPVHETATYRFDDTRCCVMQFWPPDNEHMCSKHVEAWNKTYCKTKILCIKLVKYWDARSAKRQNLVRSYTILIMGYILWGCWRWGGHEISYVSWRLGGVGTWGFLLLYFMSKLIIVRSMVSCYVCCRNYIYIFIFILYT